jgi:hypothetical protein
VRQGAHAITFRAKLDKWQKEGKRISVSWGDGPDAVGMWTNANDAAIFSLFDQHTGVMTALQSDQPIPRLAFSPVKPQAVAPPSTGSATPLTNDASSDSKNNAALAISSG